MEKDMLMPWAFIEEVGKLISMIDSEDVSDELRRQVQLVWKFVEEKVEKERKRNEYIKNHRF